MTLAFFAIIAGLTQGLFNEIVRPIGQGRK